jgi:hypothetical protein
MAITAASMDLLLDQGFTLANVTGTIATVSEWLVQKMRPGLRAIVYGLSNKYPSNKKGLEKPKGFIRNGSVGIYDNTILIL